MPITDEGKPVEACAHEWTATIYTLVAVPPPKGGVGLAVRVCRACGHLQVQNPADLS